MEKNEIQRLINEYTDNFLTICYEQNEMTTSDLQGAIEAQVRNLIDRLDYKGMYETPPKEWHN